MMKLYLWGSDGTPSWISPESMALARLVREKCKPGTLEIVYSNNPKLSPDGRLPLLVGDQGKLFLGYEDICYHLWGDSEGKGGDSDVFSENFNDLALLNTLSTDLRTLVNAQLFINKQNYRNFTRYEVCKLLPWTMRYVLPQQWSNEAKLSLEDMLGITVDCKEVVDDADKENILAQSKPLQLQESKKKHTANELNALKQSSLIRARCSKLMSEVEELKQNGAKSLAVLWLYDAQLYVLSQLPSGLKDQEKPCEDKVFTEKGSLSIRPAEGSERLGLMQWWLT